MPRSASSVGEPRRHEPLVPTCDLFFILPIVSQRELASLVEGQSLFCFRTGRGGLEELELFAGELPQDVVFGGWWFCSFVMFCV